VREGGGNGKKTAHLAMRRLAKFSKKVRWKKCVKTPVG